MTCPHVPGCPDGESEHCYRAHIVSDRSEQGWSRLCNGVTLFHDGYYLTPAGRVGATPGLALAG